jgi:hypothetical protein
MNDTANQVPSNPNDASVPNRKVVLLGASNVVIAWRTIFALIRTRVASPVEIWGAFGHGRSYGVRSRVLGRALPGITECGLWQSLERSRSGDISAIITDLGNDLMYSLDVRQIMDWVTWCVEHLRARNTAIVVTRLPIASVRALSPSRFRLMRSLLFPRSQMSLAIAIGLAEELDAQVVELAAAFGIPAVETKPEWYGFDPIHILSRERKSAWSEILGYCLTPGAGDASSQRQPRCPTLWRLAPERRWLLGVEQTRAQPACVMDDGTQIHLF